MKKSNFLKISLICATLSLAACGAGGGGGGGNASGDLTVTGVAATGAPMANATLQIYGNDGVAILASPATIAVDGTYSATIPASASGPFVFEVDNGNEKIYSVLPDKTGSVVNVTPLSNLIAARLSASGNPSTLASELAASTATISPTTTTAATSTVMTALQPLITALSLSSSINPLTASFSADGTGFDRMLDSLDVKIEPKGSSSQIEITMKQTVDEDQELPMIAFAHNATPPVLPTVDATKLVTSGLTPKIQTLLNQLTACYAVSLSSRVSSGGTTAANIQSQACRDVFLGGSPAAYKANGMVISKTQHFGGIFTAENTAGVVFSDPKFFYQVGANVPNGPSQGDVVFGYRWKDEYGNFQIEKNVARVDTDGKLKLIGNQYVYAGGVGPYSQRRNYLKQTSSTFHSTGYSFDLSCSQLNQLKSAGEKIVKVNLTSPGGRKITLVPNLTGTTCNYSYFVIASPKNSSGTATLDGMGDPSTPTGTGFVRLQSKYATGTTTVGNHPRTFDKNLAFFGGPDGTDLTDAQIEAMPQFGKWKFEYYKATAANSPVIATQYYKTTARALTIDGFKQSVKLPELTASLSSKLTNESVCATATYCYYKQVSGPFVATWSSSKESGLVPATVMARIYGLKDITATPTVGFEDRITFRSTRTTASILCGEGETSVQSYCTGSSPSAASFSTNATIDGLDLVSRSPDGTDVSHFHSLRQLQ
jgi:hypothetical protein